MKCETCNGKGTIVCQACNGLGKRPGFKEGELLEVAKGLMFWALQTVAEGREDADILPSGYDRWKKYLEDFESQWG